MDLSKIKSRDQRGPRPKQTEKLTGANSKPKKSSEKIAANGFSLNNVDGSALCSKMASSPGGGLRQPVGNENRLGQQPIRNTVAPKYQPICCQQPLAIVPGDPAPLILGIGPCRSGTSSFVEVMTRAPKMGGSIYQPLKGCLRWQNSGENKSYTLPSGPSTWFIKETIGPHNENECTFNPVKELIQRGFPPEKLKVVIFLRDPAPTWKSWQDVFVGHSAGTPTVRDLALTYKTVKGTEAFARGLGIPTHVFAYEWLKSKKVAVQQLFGQLGLTYKDCVVENWKSTAAKSHVVIPPEPSLNVNSLAQTGWLSSNGLRPPRDRGTIKLSEVEETALAPAMQYYSTKVKQFNTR